MTNHKQYMKTITLALALCMVINLFAGCAGAPAATATTQENNRQQTTAESESTAATSAESGSSAVSASEEAVPADGVTSIDYYVNRLTDSQARGEKFEKFRNYILDNTGVEFNMQYYDWGDTYNQKMNMYAAAGDLPPGIWMFGEPVKNPFNLLTLNAMGSAGMFHDWAPYLNDTANYPILKANASEIFLEMTADKETGANYIYPCNIHYSFPHAPGGLTVRYDWLEQVGLDYPTNLDEFYNMLVTFKQEITDINGNPVIPFSICGFDDPVQEYVLRFVLNSWMGSGVWYEHDGRYDYAMYTKIDELKMALTFFNKLWREDLFDKEAFSQKSEQFIEKCVNGQIGAMGYSYVTTYTASDALMSEEPPETKFFVGMPPISMNPNLPVEKVNCCEIITVPMSCLVVCKDGLAVEDMANVAKAVDFIGTYESNMMLNIGEEGIDYITVGDAFEYTPEYLDKRTNIENYGAINGYGLFGTMNTNPEVMAKMLSITVTQKDRKMSVDNIKGHQLGISDAANTVVAGEKELTIQPMIHNAFLQMVIQATSAPNEESCIALVEAWPGQMDSLGYQDWVAERTESINTALGK